MPSSDASSPCRFELRPSRWAVAALLILAVSAPLSIWASAMPTLFALPLAFVACAFAVWLALREYNLPVVRIAIEAPDRVMVDDAPVVDFRVEWRGPLAFLSWRDAAGRRRSGILWPDTFPSTLRRELRLAIPESATSRGPDSMAP
jgi:toxin CptA